MVMTSYFSVERSRKRRPSSMTTCEWGELNNSGPSEWKYPNTLGTLGTSSTAVVSIPQDIMERKVVPIPKQMIKPFSGGWFSEAKGMCAMNLVTGVMAV